MDQRSGKKASSLGMTIEDVFFKKPWIEKLSKSKDESGCRILNFINAYNGDDFPNWYQGRDCNMTDFSAWQSCKKTQSCSCASNMVNLFTIGETSINTLGLNEGKDEAIQYFRDGIDAALKGIESCELNNRSSFTYIYTAHPDKHMHALGVEHDQVDNVIEEIDSEVERLWDELRNKNYDASVILTADHGHITVDSSDMVEIPDELLECLEYANVGVHGFGRHAYFHCRTGLQSLFRERWKALDPASPLLNNFILLSSEEAISEGLYGPNLPLWKARPRMGDFVAIATGKHTIGTKKEMSTFANKSVGAHGSLLPEEMSVPYIILSPI
eukprot:CAMPEP_0116068514 /NCGR_PEP_ID=MMETSP0322-20121206/11706_1 /TAXON_ID=163516 /ORGANISM="Leptocylindrus danicus var. apora, Strain B651" /LENGTH=327 /DNA_ID=CAMNT_0003555639 /DNA_START=805 /DNA_END=1788 /DNA_ORIENTATION=+